MSEHLGILANISGLLFDPLSKDINELVGQWFTFRRHTQCFGCRPSCKFDRETMILYKLW